MALLPAYYTTTSSRKKKSPKKTPAQIAAEESHAKYLKKMGVKGTPPSDRSSARALSYDRYSMPPVSKTQCSDQIPGGVAAKSEPTVYSGQNKLIGIAVMHKSCLVPVFADNKDKAKEISAMRR